MHTHNIQFIAFSIEKKMHQPESVLQSAFCRSNNFPGGSEFTRASEGHQNGGKMTGMDVLEFRDINGPNLMPKYGAIWSIGSRGGISPPPASLGLSRY